MEYNHERAVADGVNVGYDVYRIKTEVTEQGGKVEKGFYVDRRSKDTRKTALGAPRRRPRLHARRTSTAPSSCPSRSAPCCKPSSDALFTELFPGRTLVPKTLIFAKDDSHAEDIVHLCREVFGKGNDFCKKITYQTVAIPRPASATRSPKALIQEFRTLARSCASPSPWT